MTVPGEEIAVTHGSNVYGFVRNLDEYEGAQIAVKETRKDLRLVVITVILVPRANERWQLFTASIR